MNKSEAGCGFVMFYLGWFVFQGMLLYAKLFRDAPDLTWFLVAIPSIVLFWVVVYGVLLSQRNHGN